MPVGKQLTRKLGPLPVWVWALLGALAAYVLYRHFVGSSGSGGAAQETQTVQAQTPSAAMGLQPSAGSPSDTGQGSSDLVAALGGQQASLLAALEQANQDVVGLAQSQIAYAQTQTNLGSFSTQTAAAVDTQPGGANAPQIIYLSPTIQTVPGAAPAAVPTAALSPAKPAGKQTSVAPARYYTYKRDVKLASGQTVHFAAGRGYYAS